MTPVRITHASGRYDRSPASLGLALDRLAVNADVLTGTEVANPLRGKALALVGWLTDHFFGAGRGEAFVDVKSTFGQVLAKGTEQVSTIRFRRKGWWAVWAVVRTPDGLTLISAAHTPASWRILRQRKAWEDGCRNWAVLLDRLAIAHDCTRVIVAADWNRNLASAKVRADLERLFPGFTVAAPDKPTHDVRRIDGLLVKGYTVDAAHTLHSAVYRAASDHKPVAFTLTPVPQSPSTQVPKEQPVKQELAVDYSSARPGGARIKNAGYVAVGRYIALGTSDKWLTASERDDLHASGLGIWLVAEGAANRAAAGDVQGVADAHAALAAANALGYPDACPIFFAVDFDAEPGQVRDYFRGVVSVLGDRAGDYGGIKITEAGLTKWHWQTAAWSGGKVSPQAHIYQRLRPTVTHPVAETDENVLCLPIPLWGPKSTVSAPKPTPAPAPAPVKPPRTRGGNVDAAVRELRHTKGGKHRMAKIRAALKALLSIRPWHKRK